MTEAHPAHFKACAACRIAAYCSKEEHQAADWCCKAACKAARKAAAAAAAAPVKRTQRPDRAPKPAYRLNVHAEGEAWAEAR
jgi:hypothetical protein